MTQDNGEHLRVGSRSPPSGNEDRRWLLPIGYGRPPRPASAKQVLSRVSGAARPRRWQEKLAWATTPPLVRAVGKVAWQMSVDLGEGFPDPPFVLAANHHSFLDAFIIGAIVRDEVRFLALEDLFGNYRWVDYALRTYGVIPLRRGVVPLGPVRAALAHLSADGVVGLFPEGTRHWAFDPTRARPGGAWLATRVGVPLVPVALMGTETVLGVDNRLRAGRVRVTVGPPLRGDGMDRHSVEDLHSRWAVWVAEAVDG